MDNSELETLKIKYDAVVRERESYRTDYYEKVNALDAARARAEKAEAYIEHMRKRSRAERVGALPLIGDQADQIARLERELAEARHGNKEWVKMFDAERASKLEYQDQLAAAKAEMGRLRTHELTAAVLAKDMEIAEERDRWKLMAGKLAEALKKIENSANQNYIAGGEYHYDFDPFLGSEALAEFEGMEK